jgi:hypothetical protein
MLKANLISAQNYTGENLAKLNRSLHLIESALNSDRFKQALLNFTIPDGIKSFHFKTFKCRFLIGPKESQLPLHANSQVYEKIMKGNAANGVDTLINFKVHLRPGEGGSTVGSTGGDDIIHTFEGDFNRMSDGRFAAHLVHEYCHTIGFSHSFSNRCDKLRDCFSVPYAIGNIVEIILTGANRDNCAYIPF